MHDFPHLSLWHIRNIDCICVHLKNKNIHWHHWPPRAIINKPHPITGYQLRYAVWNVTFLFYTNPIFEFWIRPPLVMWWFRDMRPGVWRCQIELTLPPTTTNTGTYLPTNLTGTKKQTIACTQCICRYWAQSKVFHNSASNGIPSPSLLPGRPLA